MKEVHIIGAGLAGSEAAWQLAKRGVRVVIHEMRGVKPTEAHLTENFAELVCSNSFRSDDINNAVGLLHQEMRMLDSLIMSAADNNKVPAGSALAVDREAFSLEVQNRLLSLANIEVVREEITDIPRSGLTIVSTGPLTSASLSQNILAITGEEYLAFFDAIAPIVYRESINFDIAWMQSRYDKGEGSDYINCPLTREQYYSLVEELVEGDKTDFKEWEKDTPYFNGCLPIEVMAVRGRETLRFGPLKPVGLTNPRSSEKPYAVVQLRQDNKLGTLYNIVGFQTKLKYADQVRVFQKIPGLENAEFARLGGLHRNTFIKSPVLLDQSLSLKKAKDIKFAGQITGVEGYLESAASGMLAGIFAAAEVLGRELIIPPRESALGSLHAHITSEANSDTFQPMNINFGLFPDLDLKARGDEKKQLLSKRAIEAMHQYSSFVNYSF